MDVVFADPFGSLVQGFQEGQRTELERQEHLFQTFIQPMLNSKERELDRQLERDLLERRLGASARRGGGGGGGRGGGGRGGGGGGGSSSQGPTPAQQAAAVAGGTVSTAQGELAVGQTFDQISNVVRPDLITDAFSSGGSAADGLSFGGGAAAAPAAAPATVVSDLPPDFTDPQRQAIRAPLTFERTLRSLPVQEAGRAVGGAVRAAGQGVVNRIDGVLQSGTDVVEFLTDGQQRRAPQVADIPTDRFGQLVRTFGPQATVPQVVPIVRETARTFGNAVRQRSAEALGPQFDSPLPPFVDASVPTPAGTFQNPAVAATIAAPAPLNLTAAQAIGAQRQLRSLLNSGQIDGSTFDIASGRAGTNAQRMAILQQLGVIQ
jgi:hypothetical protein